MREQEKNCGCAGRRGREGFDAEVAYRRLSLKVTELADIVTRYMSQAGLERDIRASNAERLAQSLERIVGGKPVKPGSFPECCLIGQRSPNGTIGWFCTGVLVHPRIVLTAAHCHETALDRVNVVVALNADNKDQLSGAEIINALRVRIHPDYEHNGPHDIAVIVLKKSAVTQPVPVATTDELIDATRTRLVGFGDDDILSTRGFGVKREVEVDITRLRRSEDDDFDEDEELLGFESDLEFTAGGGGFDSCNGDSGGPAYILAGGGRKVAGLTSRAFVHTHNPCGEGGAYTRIDVNMDFVRHVAGAAGIDID